MKRLLLLAAVIVPIVAAPSAEAKWPKVALADGQAAITRYLDKNQHRGYNTSYELTRCRLLSRRTVICKAVEFGVCCWEGDVLLWSRWWPRAMRKGNRVVVYHPYMKLY